MIKLQPQVVDRAGVSSQSETQMSHGLYLGIYKDITLARSQPERRHYDIFVASGREYLTPKSDYPFFQERVRELAAVRRIPDLWGRTLSDEAYGRKINRHVAHIGHIMYTLPEDQGFRVAISNNYYPRKYLKYGVAVGMPYFIEAMTASMLRKEGVTGISSSGIVDFSRKRQLSRAGIQVMTNAVGIPVVRTVKTSEWLKAMGRGIRCYIQALRESNEDLPEALLQSRRS